MNQKKYSNQYGELIQSVVMSSIQHVDQERQYLQENQDPNMHTYVPMKAYIEGLKDSSLTASMMPNVIEDTIDSLPDKLEEVHGNKLELTNILNYYTQGFLHGNHKLNQITLKDFKQYLKTFTDYMDKLSMYIKIK